MTTTHTIDTATRIPIYDAVRAALIELLTTQHYDAATTCTLRAVGEMRTNLIELHRRRHHNPIAHHATAQDRLIALNSALGQIADALLTQRPHPDIPQLHDGLTVLTALALAWLDTLPHPDTNEDDDGYHACAEPEPF
ncbi:MAG: hypothetical protein JO272_13620 [Pseudonocardiales bacterium]|nr:hypothetical protein [Pseudonocardiales bacterium]